MGDRTRWMLGATAAVLAFGTTAPGLQAQNGHHDAEQIRSLIMSAYIHGLQSNGSRDDIRAGFHPEFVMKVLGEGGRHECDHRGLDRPPAPGRPGP